MCYLVAKDRNAHGCFALKTTHGKHLVELKRELNKEVGYKGVQLVTISRPTAYAVEAILCYKVPIGCYCKIFKREIMETTRFMPEVFIGEGFNFNIAAFQKSTKTVAGSLKTYYYRRDNPTSAMTKFSIQKCECGLLALEIIKEKLQIRSFSRFCFRYLK